ncbi:hypothetical protein, partial [Ilumatobacter sp.]|uniref:hypothetical protein n=1 Tax=Ilumatobacter sp. TaxID=1967498 RepID=UPI003F6C747E
DDRHHLGIGRHESIELQCNCPGGSKNWEFKVVRSYPAGLVPIDHYPHKFATIALANNDELLGDTPGCCPRSESIELPTSGDACCTHCSWPDSSGMSEGNPGNYLPGTQLRQERAA